MSPVAHSSWAAGLECGIPPSCSLPCLELGMTICRASAPSDFPSPWFCILPSPGGLDNHLVGQLTTSLCVFLSLKHLSIKTCTENNRVNSHAP